MAHIKPHTLTAFLMVLCFSLATLYVPAYAGSTADEVVFQLTGGLLKAKEATFDEKRTLTGAAPKDTEITITHYGLEENPDKTSDESPYVKEVWATYVLNVGNVNLFSQSLSLKLGENFIDISAIDLEGSVLFEDTFQVTRKPGEIKAELEKSIVLPAEMILKP